METKNGKILNFMSFTKLYGIFCFGKKKEAVLILNSQLRILYFFLGMWSFTMESCNMLIPKAAGEKSKGKILYICETSKDLSMDKTRDC